MGQHKLKISIPISFFLIRSRPIH